MAKKKQPLNQATHTALLPQYRDSPAVMERFLDAIHQAGAPIARTANQVGTKRVSQDEMAIENFMYFEERKTSLESEFTESLKSKIGTAKADWFVRVVAEDWFDGARKRRGRDVVKLRRSIREYLTAILGSAASLEQIVQMHMIQNGPSALSACDVARILQCNHEMMIEHMPLWLEQNPARKNSNDSDIFLHRGISLEAPLNCDQPYRELDYISSYSIALSVPEQFASMQIRKNSQAGLVHGAMSIFEHRLLFFSPFIRGMQIGQLEVGVIPSLKPLPIRPQGSHSGMLEYLLDPQPWELDAQVAP